MRQWRAKCEALAKELIESLFLDAFFSEEDIRQKYGVAGLLELLSDVPFLRNDVFLFSTAVLASGTLNAEMEEAPVSEQTMNQLVKYFQMQFAKVIGDEESSTDPCHSSSLLQKGIRIEDEMSYVFDIEDLCSAIKYYGKEKDFQI